MNKQEKQKRKKLAITLTIIFLLALFLGPGPGLYLINPNPADPNARFTFLGMPIIYAWALLWLLVESVVVVIAYLKLWDSHKKGRINPN